MYRAMPLRQPQSLPTVTGFNIIVNSLPLWPLIVAALAIFFPNSDPEQPNRTLSCDFPEACEDCSVHTRRTAGPPVGALASSLCS